MKLEWKTCFRIGVTALLFYLCVHYLSNLAGIVTGVIGAASPLIAGCVIAYPLNILMSFYEKLYFPNSSKTAVVKSRRGVCLIGAILTLVAVVSLVVSLVVPQLVSCVQLLIEKAPDAMDTVVAFLGKWDIVPEDIVSYLESVDWKSVVSNFVGSFKSGIGDVLGKVAGAVSSVFSGVLTTVIGFIFAVYILSGKDKLKGQLERILRRYIRNDWYEKLSHVLSVANDSFRRYIVGQCTEACILGLMCGVGMLILRLPYAAMMGALVAFTALIPVAGAYISGLIGALMILTVSPTKALIFVVFLVLLQQFEGNIIYPRVVGSSMGLPGIWVFSAVTVGGGMLGIVGMLLGVPVASTVYKLIREDVHRSEGEPSEAAAESENEPQQEASTGVEGE